MIDDEWINVTGIGSRYEIQVNRSGETRYRMLTPERLTYLVGEGRAYADLPWIYDEPPQESPKENP